MVATKAYGAVSASEPLVPLMIERRELGAKDVLIEIRYTGICHSDIHTVRSEWRKISYPQVVGHEIVGLVSEVGAEVTRHRVGDRVGVGCLVNSCRECENCRAGQEQYCLAGAIGTYASRDVDGSITQGGYAQHIVVNQDFVLSIPDRLPLDAAAPLLCAGITPYSPLRRWGAGPGKRVAVVGMGGLGHLAVKFAVALGAEVVVLSQTTSKRDDGLRFGAKEYYATSAAETFQELANTFDLIINTVSVEFDVNQYLRLLRLDGTLVNIGAPPQPLPVKVFNLFTNRRSFAGSSIGSLGETQEMLDFCAEHGVLPEIEVISAEQINEAYERVLRSDVRYRFVIDVATLDAAHQDTPTA